jgi:hypothetical protein
MSNVFNWEINFSILEILQKVGKVKVLASDGHDDALDDVGAKVGDLAKIFKNVYQVLDVLYG